MQKSIREINFNLDLLILLFLLLLLLLAPSTPSFTLPFCLAIMMPFIVYASVCVCLQHSRFFAEPSGMCHVHRLLKCNGASQRNVAVAGVHCQSPCIKSFCFLLHFRYLLLEPPPTLRSQFSPLLLPQPSSVCQASQVHYRLSSLSVSHRGLWCSSRYSWSCSYFCSWSGSSHISPCCGVSFHSCFHSCLSSVSALLCFYACFNCGFCPCFSLPCLPLPLLLTTPCSFPAPGLLHILFKIYWPTKMFSPFKQIQITFY